MGRKKKPWHIPKSIPREMPPGIRKLEDQECVNILELLKEKIGQGRPRMKIVADIVVYLRSRGWTKEHALARAGNIVKRALSDTRYNHEFHIGYLACYFKAPHGKYGVNNHAYAGVKDVILYEAKLKERQLERRKEAERIFQFKTDVDPPTC